MRCRCAYRPPRASSSRMRALLHQAAVVEHQHLVGVFDRRQPVRDDQRRAVGHQIGSSASCTRRSDSVSSAAVASSRIRIGASLQHRARDRQALALAAGQQRAVFADWRVQPLRQALDELPSRSPLRPRRASCARDRRPLRRRRCWRRCCRRTASPAARPARSAGAGRPAGNRRAARRRAVIAPAVGLVEARDQPTSSSCRCPSGRRSR